jgi:hypothetical protein
MVHIIFDDNFPIMLIGNFTHKFTNHPVYVIPYRLSNPNGDLEQDTLSQWLILCVLCLALFTVLVLQCSLCVCVCFFS